jgi:biopolymer transport protein ExbD
MAQLVGTNNKGSVNVEINIVPFVDVMSCLTAFLLVTAVWINTAHLKNEAAGKKQGDASAEHQTLSVLIQWDQMLVTAMPSGETRQLAPYDWGHLGEALKELQPAGETPHVEIAADSSNEHPISYQQLVAAMDTSVRAGFNDVGVTEPRSLSGLPQR